ncbi:MAG: PilZ domain-containing protein [Candidatus Manganitrophaceae bacterium]
MPVSGGTTKANRRQSPRIPFFILEVKGKHSNRIFVATAENISRGGLFLSSSKPLKIGDRFPIEFVLPDNKTTVRCTCEVAWKKKYDVKGVVSEGVGVRFVDLPPDQKKIINVWIEKEEKKERRS